MNFVIDENVSLSLTGALRSLGHDVVAVAGIAERGMSDTEVWALARKSTATLITRDHHFTNPT